ncbi:MAG: choice-of-anchor L domain-containing protein [Bacteroidia bacterium]
MVLARKHSLTGILLFWAAFSFIPNFVFAQLSVASSNSANALAQAIAGSGVTVSNAVINCGNNASGTFTYSGSNLGLTGGIILTTGSASDAANAGTYLCNVNNGNNFSDPDLTAIVSSADLDVCILEFDFVPTCNALNMTYVFGSEEYPQGVGHFNDAFGIFLTGPNPSGGNYSSQNISTLPNSTPVSINNVNANTNASYFHNNYSSPNNDIAYGGYTIPVTSSTPVVPCSTYHTKIAIADGGNALYDSGVMISNNGISCQVPATITASATQSSGCSNTGSATATVTGYSGTVTYHWYPGGQTTATISNLASGTYSCAVSLHQVCGLLTQTVTATVTSAGSNIVVSSQQTNLTCNGASNGSATVTPVGGIAPYTCNWNTTPPQSGLTVNNLPAGTTTGTITDNGGCSTTIQIHITAPAAMQLSFFTTAATCTGATGTASVNVTANGTAPYTYTWNTSPVQTTQTASNLPQGPYTVTVTGANGCSVSGVANVGTQNPTWSLSATTQSNVPCYGGNNGAMIANINSPGTSTFSYSWSTTPVQTTQSALNVPMGTYTCTVTDNNGCIKTAVANVGMQNPSWNLSATQSNVACYGGNNGSVTANINNAGTSAFSYSWSTVPAQTTQSASNLSAGTYTCTVTDNNGCTETISANVSQPAILTATVTSSPTQCQGNVGSVSASATGGTQPYSYLWSNAQNTNSIQGLSQGQYSVTVTDAHNCTASSMAFVGVINPTLQVTFSSSNSICGGPSGSINVNSVTNGTAPYSFVWATGQTTQNLTQLSPGIYVVDVTDINGCSGTASVPVNITNILPLTVSSSPDYCQKSIGSASAAANGNPPYTYAWNTNPPQSTQTAGNLPAGNYSVTVTDAYGCKDSMHVIVVNHSDLFTSAVNVQPADALFPEEPISINVTTNGGWNYTGGTLSDGTAIPTLNYEHIFAGEGDYVATYYFTSINGCFDSVKYTIHIKDEMSLYIPNSFTPNHDGRNDEFKAKGTLIRSFELYIYDNWGNLITKLNGIEEGWNGKNKGQDAPAGVYIYKGVAVNENGEEKNFNGHINLIR